jgi:hypothetical protein
MKYDMVTPSARQKASASAENKPSAQNLHVLFQRVTPEQPST